MRKEKKYHFIYKTTNLKNNKFYLGMHSTDNLNDGYLGSGDRLRRSIRRNGKENFKIEILEFLPNRKSLSKREKEIINEDVIKDPKCMNLALGGQGGFINNEHRKKFLEERFNKNAPKLGGINGQKVLSELRKNTEFNIMWKQAQSNGLKGNKNWVGKKHKEKSKIKIGEANSLKQKGQSNSQFGTCWITNGAENKKIKKTNELPQGWFLGRIIK